MNVCRNEAHDSENKQIFARFLLNSATMKFVPAHDVNGREKKQEFNSSEANTKTNKRWLDGIAGVNMK